MRTRKGFAIKILVTNDERHAELEEKARLSCETNDENLALEFVRDLAKEDCLRLVSLGGIQAEVMDEPDAEANPRDCESCEAKGDCEDATDGN